MTFNLKHYPCEWWGKLSQGFRYLEKWYRKFDSHLTKKKKEKNRKHNFITPKNLLYSFKWLTSIVSSSVSKEINLCLSSLFRVKILCVFESLLLAKILITIVINTRASDIYDTYILYGKLKWYWSVLLNAHFIFCTLLLSLL